MNKEATLHKDSLKAFFLRYLSFIDNIKTEDYHSYSDFCGFNLTFNFFEHKLFISVKIVEQEFNNFVFLIESGVMLNHEYRFNKFVKTYNSSPNFSNCITPSSWDTLVPNYVKDLLSASNDEIEKIKKLQAEEQKLILLKKKLKLLNHQVSIDPYNNSIDIPFKIINEQIKNRSYFSFFPKKHQ